MNNERRLPVQKKKSAALDVEATSISQIAKTAATSASVSINSLDVMQALATSFAYNGSFGLTVGGQNVPVPNGSNSVLSLSTVLAASGGGGATFSSAMGSAATAYLGTASAISLGFNNTTTVPSITYTTSPSVPAGQATITPPAPPVNLPSTQPTVSGPPSLPGAPAITYSSNLVLTKGSAMTTATPSSTGTVVASCLISPTLPTGLSLSSSCAISGTPTVVAAQASYTVTAKDQANVTSTSNVTITVNDVAPSGLTYSSPSPIYFIGGNAITANTPSNSGGTVVSYSVLPTLPAGLSLNSSTGVISGTPTAVSPVAAANYVVTATNSGGSTTSTISITLNYPTPSNATNFTATVYDYYSGTLSWTGIASSGFFTGYKYAYQTGATAPTDCSGGTDVGNTTSPQGVLNLASGTQYTFRLCTYFGFMNGSGGSGGLSTGVTATFTTPSSLIASQVTAGGYHACASTNSGTVYCWGSNLYGQLGNNSATTGFQTPQQVVSTSGSGSLGSITAISAGSRFTCALNSSHNVYCWGDNSNGELGNGTTTSTKYPVEVLGVGGSGFLSNITAIAAGSYHVCALNSSGNVYCWGANAAGQLGNNTTTNSTTPVEVLGLNGTGFLSSVTALSSNGQGIYGRSCAVSSGNVYCWGSDNNPGGLSSGSMVPWKVIGIDGVTPLANIVAVSVSTSNNCYVNSSGNVFCEGDNLYGEWGSNLVSGVAYGISTNLTSFMEAHGLLNSGFLSGITSVTAGSSYIFAVNSSGTAYAWGNNSYGSLGIGSTTEQHVPVVSGFTNVTSLAAGMNYTFTCAVDSSGAVHCVGDNVASELGNNTSGGQVTTPVGVYGFH